MSSPNLGEVKQKTEPWWAGWWLIPLLIIAIIILWKVLPYYLGAKKILEMKV